MDERFVVKFNPMFRKCIKFRMTFVLDCKTAVFFANASDGPYSNERLERVKKRRGRMVRDSKKYGCPPCIYQIRSKLPVLQQREIPIALILTQSVIKCQSHLIKKVCISFTGKPRGKMNDVDLDGLASDL